MSKSEQVTMISEKSSIRCAIDAPLTYSNLTQFLEITLNNE